MSQLPAARVKTIMRSSVNADAVSKEAVFVLSKAAEEFLKNLCKAVIEDTKPQTRMEYVNVSNVIHKNVKLEFLHEIIPQKITVGEYKKLMQQKQKKLIDEDDVVDINSDSDD